MTELDVRKNEKLEEVFCSWNNLKQLDISRNDSLKKLYCSGNQLTELDISANGSLEYMYCNYNQLTQLDVSGNENLLELDCRGETLVQLDISHCANLSKLVVSEKILGVLDINSTLKQLEIYSQSHLLDTSIWKGFDSSKISELDELTFSDGIFTVTGVGFDILYGSFCYGESKMKVRVYAPKPPEPEEPVIPPTDNPFSDVPQKAWYADTVKWIYEHKIMEGKGDGKFDPTGFTTRAETVQILYGMLGKPEVSGALAFTDIRAGIWYENAVKWAVQNKLTSGKTPTTFEPNSNISRQEVAVFLYQYAKLKGYDTSGRNDLSDYTDNGRISKWAKEALQWANHSGIMAGNDRKELNPLGNANRAEIAAMVKSFILKYEAEGR